MRGKSPPLLLLLMLIMKVTAPAAAVPFVRLPCVLRLRSMTFSSLPNTSSTNAQSGADVAGGFVAATIDFMNWSYAERWRVMYECPRAAMEGEDLILHARLEQARKELRDLKERQKKLITSYLPDDKRKRKEHLSVVRPYANTRTPHNTNPSQD